MTRHTYQIEALIATVNRRNRESTCAPEVRQGWNSLLETVLHDAGRYHGFGYLRAAEVPPAHPPGIVWDDTGEGAHLFPDETRRFYYQ